MEVETARAFVQAHCDAQQAPEPIRHYLERDVETLLPTIQHYVSRSSLSTSQGVQIVALEVLSQVVIEALKSQHRFDATRPPRAWLLGIAVKVIQRLEGKQARRVLHEVTASELEAAPAEATRDESFFDRLAALSPLPPEQALEEQERVQALLGLVSKQDQDILRLAIIEDLDGEALANALQITPGAARVRLFRAVARLRAAYEAAGKGGTRHE